MLLDGKSLAKKLRINLKKIVSEDFLKFNISPTLAIIQVGDNPSSNIYVRNKLKALDLVGMRGMYIHFDEEISEEELLQKIFELNKAIDIHGIICQLPLPKHLSENKVIEAISPEKDVDGFTSINRGRLFSGLSCLEPATPKGIIRLLKEYNIDITSKKACVIGRSNIVGKPLALMLLKENATVTICHSRTTNLPEITREQDIIISAVGKPNFLTKNMVKEGVVIVDVGTNYVDSRVCGDVDFDAVQGIASYISPVPFGVGPMTIESLLENTYIAYKEQIKRSIK